MVDAQEFERLTFSLAHFTPEVLEELRSRCAETVVIEGDEVHISHLYIERRIMPLDLYLRAHDDADGISAAIDYGQALRDLAITNTFPGDLLLKNFGVTRRGRVIFYDYDEVALVTDCNFRELPTASADEDEMRGEPWYYVGEHDVFPEEFLKFLSFSDAQRNAFLGLHSEILTAAFWRSMQRRIESGEVIDISPYGEDQKLARTD
jgi:isocitrate dehydrogenase kinase/phosphatase